MRVGGRDRFLRLAGACVCAVGISILSASPGLAKYASVIMDAETGRVVYAVNENTRNYPASPDSLTGVASGDVRFTPESRHRDGCRFTSACDPKRTLRRAALDVRK